MDLVFAHHDSRIVFIALLPPGCTHTWFWDRNDHNCHKTKAPSNPISPPFLCLHIVLYMEACFSRHENKCEERLFSLKIV